MGLTLVQRLSRVYRVLANPARVRILTAIEHGSQSFSELMRALGLNPKTLSAGLGLMTKCGMVRKSYPYRVYVITPLGRRIVREQILALRDSLESFPEWGPS